MSYRILIVALIFVIIATPIAFYYSRHRTVEIVVPEEPEQPQKPDEPIEEPPPEPKQIEPEFVSYPQVRSVSEDLGKVLKDIESHMPANHIYKDSDKITWGHETTHGINSHLRMKFSQGNNASLAGEWTPLHDGKLVFKSYARINGFYVLNDRAVIIKEPATTIRAVAKTVPPSLRGDVYNLYLVQQAQSWDDTPLYLVDELSSYTNGSEVRYDLGIQTRSETVLYMLEFTVYSLCIPMASNSDDPQLKNFLAWQVARTMKLYQDSKQKLGGAEKQDAYLAKIRTSEDAEQFRSFVRKYLGEAWVSQQLGF